MSNADCQITYKGRSITVSEEDCKVWLDLKSDAQRDEMWRSLATIGNTAALAAKTVEPETLSIEATLAQRGKRYGDFSDHARLSQGLLSELICFNTKDNHARGNITPWEQLDPVKKQALTVICDKIARILSGDPNYDDNWIDIQGYAKLVQDRLPKESN